MFRPGGARPPLGVIDSFIGDNRADLGAWPICEPLASAGVRIAPSAYRARTRRSPSARSVRDENLKTEIGQAHADNHAALGARRMHVLRGRPEVARRRGAGHVARCTAERFMRAMGLHGIRRAESPRTTRSAPCEQCPADLVNRHFSAFKPNELWGRTSGGLFKTLIGPTPD